MNASPHKKELVKLLRGLSHRYHLWDVFGHFIELAALSISNAVDLTRAERREAQYMQVIGRYTPEEAREFPKMFAALVGALEDQPGDVLGEVFGELELGNAARGQFFTPYHLCELMARLTVDDRTSEIIAERGFITVQEPAVGAGAMVIAMADCLKNAGHNPATRMHVTAVDVDVRAVHMAYVQFSLLGIPAVVIVGNTIAGTELDHFYTPVHFLEFWPGKLRRGYALGSRAANGAETYSAATVEPYPVPAAPDITAPQMSLF